MCTENTYVSMHLAPVNNNYDDLWLRQEIGSGTSGRRENSGLGPGRRFAWGRCEEMDMWYLSTGDQAHGRMENKISRLFYVLI